MNIDLLGRRIVWEEADDGTGGGSGGGGGAADDGDSDDDDESGSGGGSPDDDDDSDDDDDDDEDRREEDPEKKRLIKESIRRKNRIKELEKKQKESNQKLQQFQEILGEDFGVDDLKEIISSHKKSKQQELEKKGQWDALRDQMVKDHKGQTKKLSERITSLESENAQLKSEMEDMTIGQQFSNSDFIAKKIVLKPTKARVIYGSYFDMEDGEVVAYNKPRGSQNRVELVNSEGERLDFDAALERIIDADPDKESILRSNKRPGGGSTSDINSGAGGAGDDKDKGLYGVGRIAAARNSQKKK